MKNIKDKIFEARVNNTNSNKQKIRKLNLGDHFWII